MYLLGIVVAAAAAPGAEADAACAGRRPPFVMELPSYKWPSPRVIVHRMLERGWDFLSNAGTLILAVSVVMWAALYYPRLPDAGRRPARRRARPRPGRARPGRGRRRRRARSRRSRRRWRASNDRLDGAQKRQSWLGRAGRLIEPAVRPLGWDWRIGSAVIASFPAREVVVATLGVIFDVGRGRGGRPPARRDPPVGDLAGDGPAAVQHAGGAVGHGLLRPLRPVRLDPGRDPPRDGPLGLVGLELRLHDASWPTSGPSSPIRSGMLFAA